MHQIYSVSDPSYEKSWILLWILCFQYNTQNSVLIFSERSKQFNMNNPYFVEIRIDYAVYNLLFKRCYLHL